MLNYKLKFFSMSRHLHVHVFRISNMLNMKFQKPYFPVKKKGHWSLWHRPNLGEILLKFVQKAHWVLSVPLFHKIKDKIVLFDDKLFSVSM